MKLKIGVLFAFLVIVLFSNGCQKPNLVSPTNSSHGEKTEMASESTPTPNALSLRSTQRVETVIALQTASATPLPTRPSYSTPTLNPIQLHLKNFNDAATEESTDIEKFISPARCGDPFSPTISPNGNWFVYNCPQSLELLIIRLDASTHWLLNYDQLSSSSDIPENFSTYHWSNNNKYVYFVPSYGCCWDPPMVFLGSPIDELWQFNLQTGEYRNVMRGFDYVSFSVDDKIAVYIPQYSPPPLVIWLYDLDTHKTVQKIQLNSFPKNPTAGQVVWAPDGTKFAFLTASGGDFEYDPDSTYKEPIFSVILVDLATYSQKILIAESKKGISLLEITDSNILKFFSYETTADGSSTRTDAQYDLSTNQLITLTPAP